MKIYKKEYENVFIRDLEKRCNVNKISTFQNNPKNLDKYVRLYQETFRAMHEEIFDNLVKLDWLNRRFVYNGNRVMGKGRNGTTVDRAKSLFVRNYVGYDPKFIFMANSPLLCISRYFNDFFPNFLDGNPFEEEYKYPYKYMGLEALVVVGQMSERIDLLEYGESKKMGLEKFKDFVINYINCYNAEHGEKYLFKFPSGFMAYVALAEDHYKKQKK